MFRFYFILFFCLAINGPAFGKDYLHIEVNGEANGLVVIELLNDVAPRHVEQIKKLVAKKRYDGVAFHRVIDGFMAQTGDVKFGNVLGNYEASLVGRGGSELNNIEEEFSDINFDRGIVGMARSQNPNSANSQFFIMLEDGHFLNGNYTIFGRVVRGMEIVDSIKRGKKSENGMIEESPDFMSSVILKTQD